MRWPWKKQAAVSEKQHQRENVQVPFFFLQSSKPVIDTDSELQRFQVLTV